jgi:tol-pal system protein YbgF
MRNIAQAFVSAALVLIGVGGCARTAEERQLEAMRSDIDRIQDDRDRADDPTLGEGPAAAPTVASPASASRSRPDAPTRPPGPSSAPTDSSTVRVGTGAVDDDPAGDDYADPEDTSPRPRIRVVGSTRAKGGEVEAVDDGAAGAGGGAALDPEAKRAYDAAVALVGGKQYDRALDALAAFLVRWPDHPYADHAMYWRGECYFAQGQYARAAEQFEGVLARFPAGAKAPDALLRLGMTRQRMGNAAGAKEAFDRLAREFPQTEAARRIPQESHP